MQIMTFVAGPIDANNYLIWDEDSKEGILIDCSEYREDILDVIKNKNIKIKHILLTHGHFDHVIGVNKMKKALNTTVGINNGDKALLEHINEFGNFFIGLPELEIPEIDFNVSDGDIINVGDMKIKVLYTPGHTEGGVCYLVDNKYLFSGDTLFKGSYGRTDLFGGNYKKIASSLKDIILKLDDNVIVYPGHGEISDIGYEKKYNEII